MPLLITWCEIQGLFHDFPGPFHANPRPSLSTKTWMLYTFFQNKLYYSALLNWLILKMNNNQWPIAFRQKSGLAKHTVFVLQCCSIKNVLNNSKFLLFLEIKKELFCLFQNFQVLQPKFKAFPGPGNFFPNSRTFQDFQGKWQAWFKNGQIMVNNPQHEIRIVFSLIECKYS